MFRAVALVLLIAFVLVWSQGSSTRSARSSSPPGDPALLAEPRPRGHERHGRWAVGERVVDPPDREVADRPRQGVPREPAELADLRPIGDRRGGRSGREPRAEHEMMATGRAPAGLPVDAG